MVKSLVAMSNISKKYPGVMALNNVNFDLLPSEVHVLFGENGAGKSTLISILSGANIASSGSISIKGEPVHFNTTLDARKKGIGIVFQEFSLVPTLTVAENLFLGDEIFQYGFKHSKAMFEKSQALLKSLNFDIKADTRVSNLSRAEQQMVEIAKALHAEAEILILDEPTASLSEKETETLFKLIQDLKSKGVGIIYISHRMQEIFYLADRITVLRDGNKIATVNASESDEKSLLSMMCGREISEVYPVINKPANKTLLEVKNLSFNEIKNVSLKVMAGEVLGFAGLVGSGKSRFWRSVMSIIKRQSGEIFFKGDNISRLNLRQMMESGIFYLTSDRKNEGLQLSHSAIKNLSYATVHQKENYVFKFLLSKNRQSKLIREISDKVNFKKPFLPNIMTKLSGGNQQKILFGKGFGRNYDVYIFDEPTVGVDVSTKVEIYQMIKSLAEEGKAIIVISSDLPEVMNLSHRLIVFSKGQISSELIGEKINEPNVLKGFYKNYSEKKVS